MKELLEKYFIIHYNYLYIIVYTKGVIAIKKIFHHIADYLRESDKALYILCIGTTLFGSLAVLSTTYYTFGGLKQFLMHILGLALGLFAAVIISLFNYRTISKWWMPIAAVILIPVILTFFIGYAPPGTDDKAWLLIGGFSLQPAEFLKFAFIISFSHHLNRVGDNINKFRNLIPLCVHGAIPVLLIHFQGDDGTALVFAVMFVAMMFVSGLKAKFFYIAGAFAAVAAPVLYFFVLNDDQRSRIFALFFPTEEDGLGVLWQQYNGRAAIANGGLFGQGMFSGPLVQSGSLPEAYNDFIFCSIGEEFGLIGCLAVIILIGAICIRIINIGRKSPDRISLAICTGTFTMLATQTLINVGMNLSLIPVIGITLPFFSAGGTSLLSIFLTVGLVMSVYTHRSSGAIYLRDEF